MLSKSTCNSHEPTVFAHAGESVIRGSSAVVVWAKLFWQRHWQYTGQHAVAAVKCREGLHMAAVWELSRISHKLVLKQRAQHHYQYHHVLVGVTGSTLCLPTTLSCSLAWVKYWCVQSKACRCIANLDFGSKCKCSQVSYIRLQLMRCKYHVVSWWVFVTVRLVAPARLPTTCTCLNCVYIDISFTLTVHCILWQYHSIIIAYHSTSISTTCYQAAALAHTQI